MSAKMLIVLKAGGHFFWEFNDFNSHVFMKNELLFTQWITIETLSRAVQVAQMNNMIIKSRTHILNNPLSLCNTRE